MNKTDGIILVFLFKYWLLCFLELVTCGFNAEETKNTIYRILQVFRWKNEDFSTTLLLNIKKWVLVWIGHAMMPLKVIRLQSLYPSSHSWVKQSLVRIILKGLFQSVRFVQYMYGRTRTICNLRRTKIKN